MQPDAAAPPEEPAARSRPRRGLIRAALKLAGTTGDIADAAISLGAAEAELSRHALPYLGTWFALTLLFGMSLAACVWAAVVLALVAWTGSMTIALSIVGGLSLLLFGIAGYSFWRVLKWASFPESRHRLMELLHSLGYGRPSHARQRTP